MADSLECFMWRGGYYWYYQVNCVNNEGVSLGAVYTVPNAGETTNLQCSGALVNAAELVAKDPSLCNLPDTIDDPLQCPSNQIEKDGVCICADQHIEKDGICIMPKMSQSDESEDCKLPVLF